MTSFQKSTALFVASAILFLVAGALPQTASAMSQFSRKFKVDCSTCHIAFPRLNYFGALFLRNGFQWPGEKPDGDTEGKEKISESLVIDSVGNWLGARVALTPLEFKTNSRTRNLTLTDTIDVGKTNFFNLFVAGSIFKNVSVFIESEFTTGGVSLEFFQLIFSNLFDTYVNFQVGLVNPAEFASLSDGKRMFLKSDILNVQSSGGMGENSINIRQSRPGILFYGYKGPLVYFGGVDNGIDTTDTDNNKNAWGGLRLEVPQTAKSYFEGSSVTYMFYNGRDTIGGVGVPGSPIIQIQNDFYRHTVSGNIRYKDFLDFQAVYQFGRDDNYALTTAPGGAAEFHGFTLIGGYRSDNWWVVMQYDEIDSDDVPGLRVNKISPSIWYFIRDNFKAGISTRFDVQGAVAPRHEAAFVLRAMF